MRHRVHGRHLNRTTSHRRAMFRNLAAGLFEHGEIRTTAAKAKAVQPFVERIITIAKKAADADRPARLAARRRIESLINDRRIHSWVADSNVPDDKKDNDYFDLPSAEDIKFNRYGELKKAPRLVEHIMTAIGSMFTGRDGGYTRIVKLDAHRLGDGTDYVILQLVGQEEGPQISGAKSTRRAIADKRTAFAAKLRKAGGFDAGAEAGGDTATATTIEDEPAEDVETADQSSDVETNAADASDDETKDA